MLFLGGCRCFTGGNGDIGVDGLVRGALGRRDGALEHDLLDEAKEDGDDDGGFEGFAEDDEEDGDAEEIAGHCDGGEKRTGPAGFT